jgi:dihydrolipoamide dehydrogenase
MDAEVAKTFQRALTKQGMKFKLSSKVTGAKAGKDGVELTVEPVAGGAAETLSADYVLVAIGRRPFTEGLGLESVGIVPTSAASSPTTTTRPRRPASGCLGDVTTGVMLAHKAEEEAVACIEMIAGKAGHVNYGIIPSVVYTAPEVAWVGQTRKS